MNILKMLQLTSQLIQMISVTLKNLTMSTVLTDAELIQNAEEREPVILKDGVMELHIARDSIIAM